MIVAVCVPAMLLGLGIAAAVVSENFDYTVIVAQAPHRDARGGRFALKSRRPDGGRIIAVAAGGTVSVLTPEFIAAADPALSFDARHVLFSGRRSAQDTWNIWEMDIDGKNKRQLTSAFGNCLEPSYLATSSITPPEFDDKVRWILFTSDQAGGYEELGQDPARAIYAQNIEPIAGRGTVTWRTTFNLSSDFCPTVISDGRVVFASHQPAGTAQPGGRYPLLVSNWDGTGLNLFYDAHDDATLKSMPCEMPDRTLVFVESAADSPDGAGRLARVSFKRPLRSRELLSKGSGTYSNPRALPDGRMLVSYSAAGETRAVYLFDFEKGAPGQKLHQDGKWDDLLALAVVEKPEPQGLLSAVADAETSADLHCINVYESDLADAEEIKPGDVKSARLVEGVAIPSPPSGRGGVPANFPLPHIRTRILGEVPVESDGSFLARIPADIPFYVQLLNADGMALESQRGWIWVRRGTSRQCLGCHENKELAPENRVTEALVKLRRHSLLQPPERRRAGADFRRNVMPIVQAKCTSCHQGKKPGGSLDLSATPTKNFNRAFDNLRIGAGKGYLQPGSAIKSPLVQMLVTPAASAGGGSRHPAVALTAEEKRVLAEWIDLGARWEN